MLIRRLFLFWSSCLLATSVHAVELYNLTDLGPIFYNSSQELQSLKLDINNNGVVVGWSRNGNRFAPMKAFVWDASQGRQVLNGDMQRSDSAMSINDGQQIVGWTAQNGKHQATLWTVNGAAWDETVLSIANSDSSEAVAIDDSDNFAGNYTDANGQDHGFLWSSNSLQPQLMNDELIDTNVALVSSGMVVGDRSINQGQANAVLVRGINDSVDLGNLGNGDFFSSASGLNSTSVVGGSFTDQIPCTKSCFPVAHGFVWDEANGLSDLLPNDVLSSWANDINEVGKIVGWRTKLPNSIAILWDNNTPLDLNALTTNLGDWSLERAQAINSTGQIVGLGTVAGETHAFLLTPNGQTASSSDLLIALASTPANKVSRRETTVQSVSLEMSNNGPDDAHLVEFKAPIPQGLRIENVRLSKGECIYDKDLLCNIDALAVNETIEATVQFVASDAASYNVVFEVESASIDGGVFDNQSLKTNVNLALATASQVDETSASFQQDDEQVESVDANSKQAFSSSLDLALLFISYLFVLARRKI